MGNFGIKSENFAHMYDVTPADAKAVFNRIKISRMHLYKI